MKIFYWMHSKLTGKQEIKKETSTAAKTNNARQDSGGEEFGDWPHGLLTIGTFGNNNNLKQELNKSHHGGTQSTSDDHLQDITPEEVNELQKEIAELLDKQVDRWLDTDNPQSGNPFKDGHKNDNKKEDRIGRIEQSTSIVPNREKDIRADQTKGSIRKKSLSFILKKMLICRSGFDPTLSLRDPVPDKSRMEKILRAIMYKKIYPRNSNPKATAKKYLETKQVDSSDSDDDKFDVENDGSKWVKTDSDYIVLEI